MNILNVSSSPLHLKYLILRGQNNLKAAAVCVLKHTDYWSDFKSEGSWSLKHERSVWNMYKLYLLHTLTNVCSDTTRNEILLKILMHTHFLWKNGILYCIG